MPADPFRLMQFCTPQGAPRALRYVTWELTHRCNASCLHCYCASGPDVDGAGELSLPAALDVADQLADAGVRVLALSGGEALLYPHWYELVRHAVGRGLLVNVASNGSCINSANVHLLKALGVQSVTISLDSHMAPVHDHCRQRRGSHQRALEAIELLACAGLRVLVEFTPTRLNWRDGVHVIALAQRLGAAAVSLSEYVAAGRGAPALALSGAERAELLREWTRARQACRGRIELMWGDERAGLLLAPAERGADARMAARILPDADILPWLFPADAVGNLVADGWRALWPRLQRPGQAPVRAMAAAEAGAGLTA